MKTTFTLLLGLLFSFHPFAQQTDSVVVVFEITDQDSKMAIEGVRVAITQGNSSTEFVSNEDGEALCTVEKFGEMKARFWHPDYSRHTLIEEIYNNSTLDTLRFDVTLTSLGTLLLDEVVVTVPGVPKVVFSSQQLSVQDFEIIDANNMILLTYPKRLKRGSRLLLFDMNKTVKDSMEISEESVELMRDYENHIYLMGTSGCKRIFVNNDKITTMDLSLYYYKLYLEPIVGTYRNKMYFSNYDPLYPAFDYFLLNVDDSSYTKFASIIDKEMMVEYRSNYHFVNHRTQPALVRLKLQAKNEEIRTGVDAQIIYGRKTFTKSKYYHPAFAPMFQIDKYLFLFDYHCDSMKIFNDNGKYLSGVGITHHYNERKSGWKRMLLKDRVQNRIYVVYEKGGFHYLHSINLTTGELREPVKLHHRYAEAIQVYDGKVYYVYRPFESNQKKYLWMEKLPKN